VRRSAEEVEVNGGLGNYQRAQPQFSAVAAPTQLEAGNVEVNAIVTLKQGRGRSLSVS